MEPPYPNDSNIKDYPFRRECWIIVAAAMNMLNLMKLENYGAITPISSPSAVAALIVTREELVRLIHHMGERLGVSKVVTRIMGVNPDGS